MPRYGEEEYWQSRYHSDLDVFEGHSGFADLAGLLEDIVRDICVQRMKQKLGKVRKALPKAAKGKGKKWQSTTAVNPNEIDISILDLGCGTSQFLEHFCRHFHRRTIALFKDQSESETITVSIERAVGIDCSADSIEFMRYLQQKRDPKVHAFPNRFTFRFAKSNVCLLNVYNSDMISPNTELHSKILLNGAIAALCTTTQVQNTMCCLHITHATNRQKAG
jgi:hypothetical protein